MKPVDPVLRGTTYYIRRRVPHRFSPIEPRGIVQISLFTDSLSVARRKAPEVWVQMIEAWEAKLAGHSSEGEARLEAAQNLAQHRGYRYLDVANVATLPIVEILSRLATVQDGAGRIDMKEADAALGLPAKSDISVSQAFDHFYKIADDRVIGKSADQLRKHRNPRLKATNAFIKAVGDLKLAAITAEDMFAFRQWLTARVRQGDLKAARANKDITYLNAMWRVVAQSKGFRLGYSSEGLSLSTAGAEDDTRPPFSAAWIRDKLLALDALRGLNTDARLILLGMVNTGYRPGEGAGLLPEEIRLDADIPCIVIQPNRNRVLKTPQSKRTIPLAGISLEAFRQARNGFPRYAEKSASLYATVNKYLRENGLLETPEHVLYSLRHSFEDRMLEAGLMSASCATCSATN